MTRKKHKVGQSYLTVRKIAGKRRKVRVKKINRKREQVRVLTPAGHVRKRYSQGRRYARRLKHLKPALRSVGHKTIIKGKMYVRSDTGKLTRYDAAKDRARIARHKAMPGAPWTGD